MATVISSPEARVGPGVIGTNVVVSVGANETSPWIPVSPNTMVTCKPGAGGTMKAQATWSPLSVVLADNLNATSNANAYDWKPGTVSEATVSDTPLINANAVRFIATTQPGVGEIAR